MDSSLGKVGGTLISKGRGCLSEILNLTPKGDQSGHGPSFFLTPKRDNFKTQTNIYFYISSRTTLNETFTAKYNDVFRREP